MKSFYQTRFQIVKLVAYYSQPVLLFHYALFQYLSHVKLHNVSDVTTAVVFMSMRCATMLMTVEMEVMKQRYSVSKCLNGQRGTEAPQLSTVANIFFWQFHFTLLKMYPRVLFSADTQPISYKHLKYLCNCLAYSYLTPLR